MKAPQLIKMRWLVCCSSSAGVTLNDLFILSGAESGLKNVYFPNILSLRIPMLVRSMCKFTIAYLSLIFFQSPLTSCAAIPNTTECFLKSMFVIKNCSEVRKY